MRTLFLQVAAVLFTVLFAGMVLIVYVGISSYLQQLAENHNTSTRRVHTTLVQELGNTPETEWPAIIARLEALLGYEISVVELAQDVAAVPVVEHESFTLTADTIVALRPLGPRDPRWIRYSGTYDAEFEREDILLLALLFLALPAVLYFSLRPIARKITDLSKVVRAYASGQLDARSEVPAPRPLEQLADNIHKMARALKFKIREQNVMTSAISHELKTPLTRMRMANDLALRENDPAAWRKHLLELDDDLTMLEKVIGETLALSRLTIEETPLAIGALPLRETLEDCLAEIAADDRTIDITVPPEASVLGNRDALNRIFVNVLSNAIRHCQRNVRVSLVSDNDCQVVRIEDDGKGVLPQHRDEVFMPFGRAENSRSRVKGGSGMGLAIASLLVEKCNGKIWLDDAPLGGARFHIALPAAASGPSVGTTIECSNKS